MLLYWVVRCFERSSAVVCGGEGVMEGKEGDGQGEGGEKRGREGEGGSGWEGRGLGVFWGGILVTELFRDGWEFTNAILQDEYR